MADIRTDSAQPRHGYDPGHLFTPTLAITKTHEPAVLVPGQPIAYIITVRNNGPSDVTGATVTDSLPNSLLRPVCVGANPSACPVSGNKLTITTSPLPAVGPPPR